MRTGIVSQNVQMWQGHPDVAYYKGYFYVVFRQSRQHRETGQTKIMLTRSRNGLRYSLPVCVAESSDRYNCPRISVVDDRLWIICDLVNQSEDFIQAENKDGNSKIVLFSSTNGVEWAGPVITNITGIVPDRICKVGNRFLIATHSYKQNGGYLIQSVWSSNNLFSKTWSRQILADVPGLNLCEASICDTGEELVCLMRENSQRGEPAYISSSIDGNEWSEPKRTRMFGCHRPVIGKLSSGNYLVTYREQSVPHTPPYWAKNTFACWVFGPSMLDKINPCSKSIILPLDHDHSGKSDSGYTGSIETEDGMIYVVNYVTKDAPKPYIVWYLLEEKEF